MLGYFQTHPLAGQFAGIIRAETETFTDGMWRGRIWALLEAISTVAIFLAERDESVVVERESLISMLPLDRIIGLVHLGQWTRPDDTTLDKLSINDDNLVMVGYSRAAPALVALLQESPLLVEPALSGAVQADPRTGRDRFTLAARIAVQSPPEAADAPRP